MNNIIVTGANGFIGKHLVQKLAAEGHYVCAVVRDENVDVSSFSHLEGIEIAYCNLNMLATLCKKVPAGIHYDTFIHLAWTGTSGDLRTDYTLQLKNAAYTCDAVRAASELGCTRFIGAGSLAQLDCMNYSPLDGSMPNTTAHYAAAKIAAQYMSKAECAKLGIDHIWGFFSNIYGIGNTTNNFINFAAKLMLQGQRAAFTNGEQNYDFVYITDFIDGLYLMSKLGKKNCSYFIGSGEPRTMREYICLIRNAISQTIQLYFGEIPFNGISLSKEDLSCEKLKQDTGYSPKISFNKGIQITVKWLREMI